MPGGPHECYFHELASYIFKHILYLYRDLCICGLYIRNLWIVVRGRLSGWLAVGIGSYRNMDVANIVDLAGLVAFGWYLRPHEPSETHCPLFPRFYLEWAKDTVPMVERLHLRLSPGSPTASPSRLPSEISLLFHASWCLSTSGSLFYQDYYTFAC